MQYAHGAMSTTPGSSCPQAEEEGDGLSESSGEGDIWSQGSSMDVYSTAGRVEIAEEPEQAEQAKSEWWKAAGLGLSERSTYHPQRTLIHGDPKAANLFFRRPCSPSTRLNRGLDRTCPHTQTTNANAGAPPSTVQHEKWEIGLIDFQWSGWGLGAVDIAYLLASSAHPSLLDLTMAAKMERHWLELYHNELCNALVDVGLASTVAVAETKIMPLETLWTQYESALLDHCCSVFSYMVR
jgi:thiamine kinase-like enzyme